MSKTGKTVGTVLLCALLGAAAVRLVLPAALPLIVAFAAAASIERAVGCLAERTGLGRAAASGACVILLYGGLSALLWLLVSKLAAELRELAQSLPQLIESVSSLLERLRGQLGGLLGGGDSAARAAVEGVEDYLLTFPGKASDFCVRKLGALARGAPSALMFGVTVVIGTYFISAAYLTLREKSPGLLPGRVRSGACRALSELKRTLGRWLRAQAIMTLIMFLTLSAAFWLLKTGYALLLALFTALVDALPVLGTGTVLIPWGVASLLMGDASRGTGLLVTYGVTAVLRSSLQAKLLGDQLGLSPLLSLFSVYAGFRLCGVWGMLLFPVGAVLLVRLLDTETAKKWLKKLRYGGKNVDGVHIQYNSGHGDERAGRDEHEAW